MKKRITAALLCAAMAVLLTGCGSDDELFYPSASSGGSSQPTSSPSAANSKPSGTASSPESNPESSAPESSAPVQNAEVAAVYDALDKVYQNSGYHEYPRPFIVGDKLFYSDYKKMFPEQGLSLYCYDLKTKENKILYTTEVPPISSVNYKNGLFFWKNRGGYGEPDKLVILDVEGTVSKSAGGMDVYDIFENGNVLADSIIGLAEMSPDLQTVVREIPKIAYEEVDVGHGLTDTQEINLYGIVMIGDTYYAFGNVSSDNDEEVFSNPADNLFYLDGEEWVRCDANTMPKEDYYYAVTKQGYYSSYVSKVFNYKTGLVVDIGNINIGTLGENFIGSACTKYYGGNYHIVRDTVNNIVYKMQLDLDGGEDIDYSKGTPLYELNTANNESFFYLDDKYYLLMDKAGIFLRTYETGEAGEEMLVRF